MENYEDIVLTEEETASALREARKYKHYQAKLKAYSEKVYSEPKQITMNEKDFFNFIYRKAVEKYPDFQVDEFNKDVIKKLCFYFTGNQEFEKMGDGYSLKKGILLFGNIGCGKTALMEVCRGNPMESFFMKNCKQIVELYEKSGIDEIEVFHSKNNSVRNPFGHTEYGYFFDDLGTERVPAVYFGNQLNVMDEILFLRHSKRIDLKRTHITTNLIPDELSKLYGNRNVSRFKELFNTVIFPQDAPDRRK